MSLRRLLLVAPIALLPILFTDTAAASPIRGSGQMRSETRDVRAFEAIVLTGDLRIVLRQGGRESVDLRADHNILPLIETRVVDRDGVPTLEIGPARNAHWSTRNDIAVGIDFVTLKALQVAGSSDVICNGLKASALELRVRGSGDLHLRGIDADAVKVEVSGSGDIETAGRTRELTIAVTGGGDVKAHALKADVVSVSIAGSGDASVDAHQTLAVSIAGSGDVTYSGDATPKTSIAGSGTVRRR